MTTHPALTFYLWSILLSYLLGSIPSGYWLGKLLKGIDIRQHGSGNPGATNVFRVLGTGPGVVTLLLDILKGAMPVLWAQRVHPESLAVAVVTGVAAIMGHTTSPFLGFRGGKGVATSAGVFGALLPLPSAIALGTFLVTLLISRMVSASSILGALALPLAAFSLAEPPLLAYTSAAIAALVIWRHRSNIRRILARTESRIGSKGSA